MVEEDEAIVARWVGARDAESFRAIFVRYSSMVYATCRRILPTDSDAEEVAQEVFVKFWEKCDTLSADSSVKSYLYRSIHNSCLNALKHEKVKDSRRNISSN